MRAKIFTRLVNEIEPDRSVHLINLHALHVLHGLVHFGFQGDRGFRNEVTPRPGLLPDGDEALPEANRLAGWLGQTGVAAFKIRLPGFERISSVRCVQQFAG